MRIKVCGITTMEDAELAIEHGAWAMGFILWPDSRRAVEPAVAAGITRAIRRRGVALVGVFVNASLDEVAFATESLALTHVQLHGDEGPSFCAAVSQRTGCKVIKALRVGAPPDLVDAERYRTDFHLLDTKKDGMIGGTGQTWDWEHAGTRRTVVPRILSGGLTAENVARGIEVVRPYAVDVASGVEASPGVKDPERLAAFFAAARAPVAAT